MVILKSLIVLALLLFPFGELHRIDIGNNIVIKPLDLVVGMTAIWWVILQVKNVKFKIKSLRKYSFIFTLVTFGAIGFISLVLSLSWLKPQEFLVSSFYLFRFLSYALLFPIVLQFDKAFKKRIAALLLFDGLFVLIVGFLQYHFYNSLFPLFHLGWDEHMHRLFSTFFDPNFAGAFLVLFLFFVGGLLFEIIEKNSSQLFSLHTKWLKSIVMCGLFLLLVFTLLAIFLTFSRAALLMLIVGTITFIVLTRKKGLLFVLFGSIILFGVLASSKFNYENMNLFREASSKARLANIAFALRVFQDHPLIGVGFNSYRYTKPLYGLQHDWTNAPSHADAGVDNSYFFVLATTGIAGFLAYSWMWISILKERFIAHRKKVQIGAIVVIASVFALFTNALFINSLFFAPLMFWIWILLGLNSDTKKG